MSDEAKAQALPTGSEIWQWAIRNSPAIAEAVDKAVNADRPREVWEATKEAGDLLVELIDPLDPQIRVAGMENIPWDQIVSIVMPILIEFIRKRRERRGA